MMVVQDLGKISRGDLHMNKRNKKKLMELQEMYEKYAGHKEFYKKHDNDKVWWVHNIGIIGRLDVSFDKKKILNLWKDYPENFTKEKKNCLIRKIHIGLIFLGIDV